MGSLAALDASGAAVEGSLGPPSRWTERILAQLGKVPAAEIALEAGAPSAFVDVATR